MHRALAALIALAVAAPCAAAQIIQVPRRSDIPVIYMSASAGLFRFQNAIADGETDSIWQFGSSLQYRGAIEMDVGNSGAAGLMVGYADAPLTYYQPNFLTSTVNSPECADRCDAHAQVWQVMGTFHMGGGIGFHQILDISAGATIYRDFRMDDTGTSIGPQAPDRDLALSIGYGFGWGFTPRLQLMLVQDAAFAMHQRDGLSGGDDNTTQQFTTRLGVRLGVGNKAR